MFIVIILELRLRTCIIVLVYIPVGCQFSKRTKRTSQRQRPWYDEIQYWYGLNALTKGTSHNFGVP